MRKISLFACAAFCAASISTANAATVTFDLSYSGASFGNSAIGTGVISFDETVLPNAAVSDLGVPAVTIGVLSFSLTISGAGSGNGTFNLAAQSSNLYVWHLLGPVNLDAQLVGQANFVDFNFCVSSSCVGPTVPLGVAVQTIEVLGGDELLLTSMAPTPLPAALPLFATGLGALGLLGWRRRRKAVT
jgi:hypothetical protein